MFTCKLYNKIYRIFFDYKNTSLLPLWLSGRASAWSAENREFDSQPRHTKGLMLSTKRKEIEVLHFKSSSRLLVHYIGHVKES